LNNIKVGKHCTGGADTGSADAASSPRLPGPPGPPGIPPPAPPGALRLAHAWHSALCNAWCVFGKCA